LTKIKAKEEIMVWLKNSKIIMLTEVLKKSTIRSISQDKTLQNKPDKSQFLQNEFEIYFNLKII
jgi:hypothetical protein